MLLVFLKLLLVIIVIAHKDSSCIWNVKAFNCVYTWPTLAIYIRKRIYVIVVFFNVVKNQLKDYDLLFPDTSYWVVLTKNCFRAMVLFHIFIAQFIRNEGYYMFWRKDQTDLLSFKKKNYSYSVLQKQDWLLITWTNGIDLMCQLMRKGELTEYGWRQWLGKESHFLFISHRVGIAQ